MTQRWIGIPEEQVLCGSERARELIERLRSDVKVLAVGTTYLSAIRDEAGRIVAFGQMVPDPTKMTDEALMVAFRRIAAAFRAIGVFGPVVINDTWK